MSNKEVIDTDSLFVLLKTTASQKCADAMDNGLSDIEGQQIAEQLGLTYNGIQDFGGIIPDAYMMTDLLTKSSITARTTEEAELKLQKMRQAFIAAESSMLNLTKKAIDWPWGKSDKPEEAPIDEGVEPAARIAPPQFQTRRSPGITDEPTEATPDQAELIQGLAASKTHIEQLQLEVKQIQDELKQKIIPIQTQIGEEGQNQLRATRQLIVMMTELNQELVQAGNQVGYYSEQVVSKKLTPSEKVKILLDRFGDKAEQAISEAQKNLDEISQVVIGKYKQWPTKTSAVEGIDEQYLSTLYQNVYNTIAGLLEDVQELNFALAV